MRPQWQTQSVTPDYKLKIQKS